MLTVFGSTALDTIRTPNKILKNVLGGAATFAAISASNFVNTGLIAVVGKDFPKQHQKTLSKHLDLKGFTIKEGKTFRYDGKFDNTLSTRETLKTELNVLENFKPTVPDEYKKSQFVYPIRIFSILIFPSAGFSLEDVVDPTGAGDSFAGAMIGYLASKKSTSLSEIKKAVVYGNVLGSFAVEKYGLEGLLQLKKSDIIKRIKLYEKMIRF
ncbi:MAG: PfkB family carbohydrate kinase [Nitrosopumilaceae archaeon]